MGNEQFKLKPRLALRGAKVIVPTKSATWRAACECGVKLEIAELATHLHRPYRSALWGVAVAVRLRCLARDRIVLLGSPGRGREFQWLGRIWNCSG